jgi:peptide chain release factor 2
LRASEGGFDLADKQQQADELEQRAADPDLWSNPQQAQGIMQRLTRLKQEIDQWQGLESRISTALELYELAEAEDDHSLRDEIEAEYQRALADLDAREIQLLLGGRYDDHDAFLSIKAGMGGTDAQDWAQMMLRMYTRWAEQRGYQVAIVDESEG